jgi:glycine cleavage system H protein
MSEVRENLKYSKEHEWARVEGDIVVVGVTDHAQSELGDIVFVELPRVGDTVASGDSFGTIEAVKTVAELYAPVSGEIIAVNDALSDAAEVINSDAYGDGWIVKIKPQNLDEVNQLLSAQEYSDFIQ